MDIYDTYGMTPLIHAAWKGDLAVVKDLVKYGADIDAETTKYVTIEYKSNDFLDTLLNGTKKDSVPKGSTALDFAEKYEKINVSEYLKRLGAK